MVIGGKMGPGRSTARNARRVSTVSVVLFGLVSASQAFAQSTAAKTADADLEEIVVTGVRQSIGSAQTLKKEASQVVDSIVAEDVGKLPDNNVADALARVTGVQIRRDSGEANTVLIRGLPNIITLLNGREVFTTRDRFIQLADVPANMLQRVDVYKTHGADLIEGGIAGTIDVRTRRPFDAPGLQLNGNARAVYSDKSKATDPDLGATISNTWDTSAGEFGALLGLSYQRRNYHEERAFNVAPDSQTCSPDPDTGLPICTSIRGQFNATHPAPVDDFKGPFVVGQIPIAGDRRRSAANFVLEWRPNSKTKLYAEGFGSDFRNEFALDFFVGLPFLGNGDISATVFPGTNQMKTLTNHDVFTITSTQANDNKTLTKQFVLGGSYETDNDLTFSTDVSRTTSTFDLRNPILDVNTTVPEVVVDTNHNGTVLLRYGGAGYDIKDGSTYALENFFDNYGNDQGESVDWRGDVAWSPSASGLLTRLSAGFRYADRKAESIRSFIGGTGRPPSRVLADSIPGLGGLSEPMAPGGPRYDLVQWYTPSAQFLLDHTDVIRAAFGQTKRPLDPGSFFSDQEVTQALYAQAELGGDLGSMPWSTVVGVRAVKTEQTLGGNSSQATPGGGLVYTPVEAKNDSTDVLPSASFKLSVRPDVIARVALGRLITRPNFLDLNPGVSLSTVVSNTTNGLTGTGGNPNLKPVKSDNLDVALEWYFAPAGSITATAFGRKFEGYVQPSFEDQTFDGKVFRIARPGNTGSGKLKGVELAYQQFYDGLPGVLSGLGVLANVTYSDGKTEDVLTGRDRTITGVSDWVYNVIGLYEKNAWSGRLAYNWRSKFVDSYAFAANASGVYDIHVDNTAQMDGSVSFKLNDNFTLTFEAVNILDTEFKDYFNDQDLYPRDTRRYDRTYELGFRTRF
jgi:TonB-dependent receptor